MATAGTETLDTASLQALLGPQLTHEQARLIYEQGPDAVVFALLSLAKQLAEKQVVVSTTPDPSAPSGQTPPYVKPTTKGRARPKGAKPGHPGHRRPTPPRIDRREEHALSACPNCHGPVRACRSSRTRIIEDIPADITPVVTEHTIPRYWCPHCRDTVEPVVPDALPGSTIGLRVVVLSAWLHYLLGVTLTQILDVFNFYLHFSLTAGGLVQMWRRLRAVLLAWYREIRTQALDSAVLHADETGWRVNGKTHWLWCFTTTDLAYYMIDRSRGSAALKKFFKKEFAGVLVTDFWAAYNAVVCARKQKCLPHLLRDLKRTQHYHKPEGDWPTFSKQLKRLIRDAIRLSKRRRDLSAERFTSRRVRLDERLRALLAQPWEERHARRLVKRLRRHVSELFTFLDHPDVPSDNNHGERQIRPAVLVRKNSYANGSEDGAETQAVLMSVFRTLKQRGYNPVSTTIDAVRAYHHTGKLPPLPKTTTECNQPERQGSMSNDPTVHNIIRLGKKNRPAPIGLAEWKDLVKRTPELRLAMEDEVLTNPFTNEPYRRTNHGDAEFRAGDDWVRLFRWQQGDLPMEADEGSISFRTLSGGEPAEDPVYQLALRLAEQLQARVFEDEP